MNRTMPAEDVVVLEALREGRQDAFEAIFNKYWQEMYATAYQRLRDQTVAEDMVQDVFTSIWERRYELQINSPLEHYLRRAIKYSIIKYLSRANLHEAAVKHLLDRVADMEHTVLDQLNVRDVNRTLAEAIKDFPGNMRQVFLLRAENYTISEIAEALGLAEQTVKNNTTEALKRLRTTLSEKHPDIHQSFYALLILLIQS
ncbi:sigma-70 family RNA polymerase sigma factor [Chitinophaga horti]|uniref:Sigma-70 family RNA polymerase sigma factor n=1 Tax=Chitinophaga horti TaxID=2920382 RepID=A0ABY6IWH0_9BACT|nr:sigma-70 family RNA polymerase sigma factor [Chitinophaga horti]UYQ91730.1 sigma-70 family RNA polymerase sigma factor [Chitinophaga horti]